MTFIARRLADLLLVPTAVLSSWRNGGSPSGVFAFSNPNISSNARFRRKRLHRCWSGPPTTPPLFAVVVGDHERTIGRRCCRSRRPRIASPISLGGSRRHHTTSVSLGAGRERRLPSSDTNRNNDLQKQQQKQQYAKEQRKLFEKEESARRKRIDQMEQRFKKTIGREDRILFLETKLAREQQQAAATNLCPGSQDDHESNHESNPNGSVLMTDAEKAELEGLRRGRDNFEEQYDALKFSDEHLAFKALHNDAFARLVRWCEEQRHNGHTPGAEAKESAAISATTSVFFLDGPDGGTVSSLVDRGNFRPDQCFVANRHESTCLALRLSGGGLLPDDNVVLTTCSEALTKGDKKGALAHIPFTGYYFDGCTGYVPHIVNMVSAALLVLDGDDFGANDDFQNKSIHPIVVGYSLLGGKTNQVEKELEVSRAITIVARSRGMRIVHALDDPFRFGLPPDIPKVGGIGGNTFTTWLILESD